MMVHTLRAVLAYLCTALHCTDWMLNCCCILVAAHAWRKVEALESCVTMGGCEVMDTTAQSRNEGRNGVVFLLTMPLALATGHMASHLVTRTKSVPSENLLEVTGRCSRMLLFFFFLSADV